jgi:hypothetical protein
MDQEGPNDAIGKLKDLVAAMFQG